MSSPSPSLTPAQRLTQVEQAEARATSSKATFEKACLSLGFVYKTVRNWRHGRDHPESPYRYLVEAALPKSPDADQHLKRRQRMNQVTGPEGAYAPICWAGYD